MRRGIILFPLRERETQAAVTQVCTGQPKPGSSVLESLSSRPPIPSQVKDPLGGILPQEQTPPYEERPNSSTHGPLTSPECSDLPWMGGGGYIKKQGLKEQDDRGQCLYLQEHDLLRALKQMNYHKGQGIQEAPHQQEEPNQRLAKPSSEEGGPSSHHTKHVPWPFAALKASLKAGAVVGPGLAPAVSSKPETRTH